VEIIEKQRILEYSPHPLPKCTHLKNVSIGIKN